MRILIYAQLPRGAMPRDSWVRRQVVGVEANPIPPHPLPPGKGGGGGGHHGSEHNYIVDRRRMDTIESVRDTDDLITILLAWLLVTNGMPWLAQDLTEKQAAVLDDDELLPVLQMWLGLNA